MATDKGNEKTKRKYGELYSQHFFEQYKLYLSGIEKISDRRESANKYFLAINTGIFVALGFFIDKIIDKDVPLLFLFGPGLLGLIISIIFYFLINSYRQLNEGKFKVVHEIEKHLPLDLYTREWIALGEGKDHARYYPFSHIEKLIPIVFGIIYLSGMLTIILLSNC
jgi:hypothetical protein